MATSCSLQPGCSSSQRGDLRRISAIKFGQFLSTLRNVVTKQTRSDLRFDGACPHRTAIATSKR
ncbi:MAG: hypothetical protein ACK6DC_06360 [Planctomycetota bacterium]